MIYESDVFTIDYSPLTDYFRELRDIDGELLGYASFDDDDWYYSNLTFVPVPRDLDEFDIDTSFEDGTSLFKNGIILYYRGNGGSTQEFCYNSEVPPDELGLYHGLYTGDEAFFDYFDFPDYPDLGVYVLCWNS